MSNNAYISPLESSKTHSKSISTVILSSLVVTLFILLGAVGAITSTQKASADTEGFSPTRWFYCTLLGQTFAKDLYRWSNTDDDEFFWFSKSSVSKGNDDVTRGLNSLLSISEKENSFVTVNETVLGRRLDELKATNAPIAGSSSNAPTLPSSTATATPTPTTVPTNRVSAPPTPTNTLNPSTSPNDDPNDDPNAISTASPTNKSTFNQGERVNPFDRLGVAGLSFTSYSGEWKYVKVDACSPQEVNDPKTGLFYEGRLAPRSPWEGQENSLDLRTRQHSSLMINHLNRSFVNTMSNWIFNITKLIVVLAIALIEFSFSDMVKLMGLDMLIAGDGNGKSGMFGALYKGFFQPMIVIIFGLTAVNMFWQGIVKRQIRNAWTIFARSFVAYIAALIAFAYPLGFLSLPNNIAVAGQTIVVQAMGMSLAGGNGLCSTSLGKKELNESIVDSGPSDITKLKGDTKYLEGMTKNIRSTIGCSFWQQFLLKPWSQGQFGTDWNNTWAKGKKPDWVKNGREIVSSDANSKMVGNASVPMGGNTILNNWAIFQISTQTNVHSPIGLDGQRSRYTAGLANDWWRIADLVSNYSEKQNKIKIPPGKKVDAEREEKYTVPANDPALEEWDAWTGNAVFGRLFVAFTSILVALVGVIAPLLFSLLSAVYSIGIAILMGFSPIMLLFACWANRGWEIFKSWAQLVINLTLKRIAIGILLVLSIMFSAAAIKVMETDNWWQGIILMVLLSYILITSRHRIIDAFAAIKFAQIDFGRASSVVSQKASGIARGATKGAVKTTNSSIAGGVSSKINGGSFIKGVDAGARSELKNYTYKNRFTKTVAHEYNTQRAQKAPDGMIDVDNEMKYCRCGAKIFSSGGIVEIGVDNAGNYWCQNCMKTGDAPSGIPTQVIDFGKLKKQRETHFEDIKASAEGDEITGNKQAQETKQKEADEIAEARRIKDEGGSLTKDQKNLLKDASKRESHISSNMTASSSARSSIKEIMENNNLTPEERAAHLERIISKVDNDIEEVRQSSNRLIIDIPPELDDYIDPVTIQEAFENNYNDAIRQIYTIAWGTWAKEYGATEFNDSLEKYLQDIELARINREKLENSEHNENNGEKLS